VSNPIMNRAGGLLVLALLLVVAAASALNVMRVMPDVEPPVVLVPRPPGRLSPDDCRRPTLDRVRFSRRSDVRTAREGVFRAVVEQDLGLDLSQVLIERTLGPLLPRSSFEREYFSAAPRQLEEAIVNGAFDCPLVAWPPAWMSSLVTRDDARPFVGGTRAAERFAKAFPGRRGILVFSHPELSDDLLDAVLYYELTCPGGCGHGAHVWLQRPPGSESWVVKVRRTTWII
jgi:hypothetical protein